MKKKLLVTMLTLAMAGSLMACAGKEGNCSWFRGKDRDPGRRKGREYQGRDRSSKDGLHPAKST